GAPGAPASTGSTDVPGDASTSAATSAADQAAVSALAAALRLRPEVLAAERQVAAADAQAAAAGWRWAPTLAGFGNLRGQNYKSFSGDQYAWAVGLELDWLLYDAGTRDAQRHQATAERNAAAAQLALLHDTISDELHNAAEQLTTHRLTLEAAQRQLDLTR